DRLAAPARVLERLRQVAPPSRVPIADTRLVRLAAAVSENAAVSSRQELYPRGMPAARTLKLSQGALLGVQTLTVAQIRERVESRYPEAERLPDRPELDGLLRDAGFEFSWDAAARDGAGCYVSPHRNPISISSQSQSISRAQTATGQVNESEITPEEAGCPPVRGTPPARSQGRLVPDAAGQPEVPRARPQRALSTVPCSAR